MSVARPAACNRASKPRLPLRAYWSLTMHVAAGFPVSNELHRGAIGDREDVRYDDGSLGILILHERTDDDPSSWLPAPEGAIGVVAWRPGRSKRSRMAGWRHPRSGRLADWRARRDSGGLE